MNEAETALASVPLFAGLDATQLQSIVTIAKSRPITRGENLIQEGDVGDTMYVLLKGRVRVSRTVTLSLSRATVGAAEKSFAELDAAEHPAFGEMALLEHSLRGATITALADGEVLELGNQDFEQLCKDDPVLGYKVIRNIATLLSARLRRTNQDVLKLSSALSLALSQN